VEYEGGMQKGLFITFEGGEGCGKSSHIKTLKERLEAEGRVCVLTREPGGTPISEKIREILLDKELGRNMTPLTELLLFAAARAQHVDEFIRPALAAGKIVISDRFYDSATAYQGAARNLDFVLVKTMNAVATGGLRPDITVLLDIPPSVGLSRAKGRDKGATDRMGSETLSFYEDVRRGFLEIAEAEKDRFVVVNSEGAQHETFEKILRAVKLRMKK